MRDKNQKIFIILALNLAHFVKNTNLEKECRNFIKSSFD